jgi:5-formyltetrahydrofolate cyclo-ligase
MELAEQKKQARKDAAKVRAAAHAALKDTAGEALAQRGLPETVAKTPGIVSGFIPYKSEVSTVPLLNRLRREGWKTALPIVIAPDQPLVFRLWQPGDRLVPGVWDIPVPEEGADEVEPDVLLVPGLSYDRAGYRLGYGGGFYDRTLAKLRKHKPVTAIGVAYQAQVVDQVVRGPHDAPLDYLMTERETIRCG